MSQGCAVARVRGGAGLDVCGVRGGASQVQSRLHVWCRTGTRRPPAARSESLSGGSRRGSKNSPAVRARAGRGGRVGQSKRAAGVRALVKSGQVVWCLAPWCSKTPESWLVLKNT